MPLFETGTKRIPSSLLHAKFGWPPFSILNTISWDWQRRKDEWENIFKDSTVGRDVKRYNATPTNTFSARGADAKQPESISEFDPYLCELMYKWFSKPLDKILDPFAGGCVRGVVAGVLNRHYYGVDLSAEQVYANQRQFDAIRKRWELPQGWHTVHDDLRPAWFIDDALHFVSREKSNSKDMVFTCPPYYNLEKYTNDPRDLSNLPTYEAFLEKYTVILQECARVLKDDSFFVIVVSEIRASNQEVKDSYYRGFVPDTIQILRDCCSLQYYNEIILENAIGSLPIRAPKYFDRFRKIGRHHQNILVFYKGDITHIEEKFGQVEI